MTPDDLLGKRKNEVHPWVKNQIDKIMRHIKFHQRHFEINPYFALRYRPFWGRFQWDMHHQIVAEQLRLMGWHVEVYQELTMFSGYKHWLDIRREPTPEQNGYSLSDLDAFSDSFDDLDTTFDDMEDWLS